MDESCERSALAGVGYFFRGRGIRREETIDLSCRERMPKDVEIEDCPEDVLLEGRESVQCEWRHR